MVEQNTRQERVQGLRRWISSRRRVAAAEGRLVGGKHPTLCLMVPELAEAWGPGVRYLRVTRPVEDTLSSLRRRRFGIGRPAIERMITTRDRDLAGHRVLDVEFPELLANPRPVVQGIAEFLEMENPDIDTAAKFVDPGVQARTSAGLATATPTPCCR